MTISILSCKFEDARELFMVGEKAFSNDLLAIAVFDRSTASAEKLAEYRAWRVGRTQMRLSGQGKHYFKAVDDSTGRIVGYMGMLDPSVDVSAQSPLPPTDCINVEVEAKMRMELAEVHHKWVGDRKDIWFVQSMCVDPEYQGQGVGKRLLQRGLEAVDKADQTVFLEATNAGSKLYLNAGFEVLEEFSLLDGRYKLGVMIRHPKQTSC